jgi:hypothetical protein
MAPPVDRGDVLAAVDARAGGDEPLDRLVAGVAVHAELVALAGEVLASLVDEARAAGCSWSMVGGALGVTKQAAQQRFAVRPDAVAPAGAPGLVEAVVAAAGELVRRSGRRDVEPADVALALLPGDAGPASLGAAALARLGIEAGARGRLLETPRARPSPGRLRRSPATAAVVERARELGASRGAPAADTGDLLEALAEGLGERLGAPLDAVRDEVARLRRYGLDDAPAPSGRPARGAAPSTAGPGADR